tara:strand:+ start:11386 stop:12192 length:807 start_codon:yes stop_codon:yes gene_type:complete
MKNKPFLSKIRLYPVKSLDPIEVTEAEVGIRSLLYDREFAMVTKDWRYVNGKRTGRVNELKTEFDLSKGIIKLTNRNKMDWQEFELREKNDKLEAYLEDFFETKISVLQRTEGEFMDMPGTSSVTIVSDETLKSLHKDLNDKSLDTLRLRFRANIELSGVPAYWEENLFAGSGKAVHFKIGDVEMIGISPRARCNVPPRNPLTGETDKSFVKKMIRSREENLPKGSLVPNYGSLYHLTVNTYVPDNQKGKTLFLGDEVEVIGAIPFVN